MKMGILYTKGTNMKNFNDLDDKVDEIGNYLIGKGINTKEPLDGEKEKKFYSSLYGGIYITDGKEIRRIVPSVEPMPGPNGYKGRPNAEAPEYVKQRRKPVICIETGQEFESGKSAALMMNLSCSYISNSCNHKTKGKFNFKYKE